MTWTVNLRQNCLLYGCMYWKKVLDGACPPPTNLYRIMFFCNNQNGKTSPIQFHSNTPHSITQHQDLLEFLLFIFIRMSEIDSAATVNNSSAQSDDPKEYKYISDECKRQKVLQAKSQNLLQQSLSHLCSCIVPTYEESYSRTKKTQRRSWVPSAFTTNFILTCSNGSGG